MAPLFINNIAVETVTKFKFLGTYVTHKLTWDYNCDTILLKARQRLYFLRKLKSYNVNKTILISFYRGIVESILTASITVWFDRASIRHLTKLQAVIRNAERIIGAPLPSLQSIYLLQLESKRNKIMNDSFHPAHQYFDMLPSGRRLRAFKGTKRFLNSTYPQTVKLYNGTKILKSML